MDLRVKSLFCNIQTPPKIFIISMCSWQVAPLKSGQVVMTLWSQQKHKVAVKHNVQNAKLGCTSSSPTAARGVIWILSASVSICVSSDGLFCEVLWHLRKRTTVKRLAFMHVFKTKLNASALYWDGVNVLSTLCDEAVDYIGSGL